MELEISTDTFAIRINQMSLLAWNQLENSNSSIYRLEAYVSMYSFGIADLSYRGDWKHLVEDFEKLREDEAIRCFTFMNYSLSMIEMDNMLIFLLFYTILLI